METDDGQKKEVCQELPVINVVLILLKKLLKPVLKLELSYLTLYTFSTENWKRPKDEVSTLMRLLLNSLRDRVNELNDNDIRLTTIGNIDALPVDVQKAIRI